MFLRLGWFGLVLLRLLLQMLIGLVLGRGFARFRRVRLGGYKVRKVRCKAVDVYDAADVFLYRDSSISPLLEMRCRFKAVVDVLNAMAFHLLGRLNLLLSGIGFLLLVLCILLLLVILMWFGVLGLVSFIVLSPMFIIASVISFMRLLFIGGMRLFEGGGIGFVRILWFILTSGSGLIWFLRPLSSV